VLWNLNCHLCCEIEEEDKEDGQDKDL
jgi:hypothetical protein